MLQRSVVFRVSIYGLRLRKGWLSVGPIHRHTRVARVNDLIRVVTLHAAIMASGSLTYLMGRGVASYYSYQVRYL